MNDLDKTRREARLEYDVEQLKDHRSQCDADMEAHGKMLLQAENRMTNTDSTISRLSAACDKDRERFDLAIRSLQDFRLRIVSTWVATVAIGMGLGSLFGFVINLVWKKV